jgi:hypothetical protein
VEAQMSINNNTEQLKKQHEAINALIKENIKLVNDKNLELNAPSIAKNISVLAGILQIHLSHEDQYLYPNLLNSDKSEIRNKAKAYIDEMGNLKAVYTDFKNKYNTKSKLMSNPAAFEKDFFAVFGAVEKRMTKEDSDLYLLL